MVDGLEILVQPSRTCLILGTTCAQMYKIEVIGKAVEY